jgi:hypothetical protein
VADEGDAVAVEFAPEVAAAGGDLASVEGCLAQALGPAGDESAVGGGRGRARDCGGRYFRFDGAADTDEKKPL